MFKVRKNKLLTEFSWKQKSKNKRHSDCRVCHRKLRKIYYEKNKDEEVKRVIKNRDKRRKVLKAFIKSIKIKCNRCSENHVATLHFHHKDKRKKEFNISQAVHNCYSKKRLLKEIKKCEVLCANCHAKEHYEGE